MTKNRGYFIDPELNSNSKLFKPTGSKNCGISLPPYIIEHLDSMRGNYPTSKFVLNLIKKALELKEPALGS